MIPPIENAAADNAKGVFEPNSFINFNLAHINSGTNSDSATLTISGDLVYNPISTILDIQNNSI